MRCFLPLKARALRLVAAGCAGAIGAGIGAAIFVALGWYLGAAIARFAQKQKFVAIRWLIYALSIIVWFIVNGIGALAVRHSQGLPLS